MNVKYLYKVCVMHERSIILKLQTERVFWEVSLGSLLSKNNGDFYIHCASSKKYCSLTIRVSCIDAVFDQNDSKESTTVGSMVVGE